MLALEFLNFFHRGTFALSQIFIQEALIGDDTGNHLAPQINDDQHLLASYSTDVEKKNVIPILKNKVVNLACSFRQKLTFRSH